MSETKRIVLIKRGLFCILLIVLILWPINSVLAKGYDNTTGKSIVSDMKAAKKSGGEITKKEAKRIFEESSPDAIAEYNDIVINEAMHKLNNNNVSLDVDQDYIKKIFELPSGGEVEIVLKDETEDSLLSSVKKTVIPNAYAATGSGTDYEGYKNYGNRKYTARLKVYGGPGSTFYFYEINHYKISKNGLTVRSAADDFKNSLYVEHKKSSSKIEDKTAEKEGYDIDTIGRVKYEYKVVTIGSGVTENARLRATVKLVKLDKKNKRAKVKQHYKSWITKYYEW